jgi:NAD(P)-dependent dehydrogenase (short-subunit alcohol dehydrogenase family)
MSKNIFDLTGRVALVTGASSGLGEHFAQVLADAGAKVVVAARRVDRLEALVEKIKSAGGNAAAVAMDVTSADSVKTAFIDAQKAFGTLDILVNNAGVAKSMTFAKTQEDDWEYVVDTNLKSAWRVARAFVDQLSIAGKPGSIVNISSILGIGVGYGESLYATSKAGLIHLTKHMALELMRNQVRVNALCPGYIETEINTDYFKSERGQAYLKTNIPSKKLGQVENLSGALLLLASDAGAFITGVALPVDGGHLLHSL